MPGDPATRIRIELRPRLSAASGLLVACVTACVTSTDARGTDRDASIEVGNLAPVVIPFGGGESRDLPIDQYYRSALTQLQESLADRDLERARTWLTTVDRPDAPAWARGQLDGFRLAARGLEWAERVRAGSRIAGQQPLPPLGAPLRIEFVVEGMAGCGVVLDPTEAARPRLGVFLTVTDTDAMGNEMDRSSARILELTETVDLDGGAAWREPFGLDLPAQSAVLRRIHVRIELLPGRVASAAGDLPIGRTELSRGNFTLYPDGTERVRADPLAVMRKAIRAGEARFFAHQFLAAHLMPPALREQAMALQIDQLRLGGRTKESIAISCLRQLAGADGPGLRQREPWLVWWNARRPQGATEPPADQGGEPPTDRGGR